MSEPKKLDLLVAFFPYGGNGGIPSEVPFIRNWWGKTVLQLANDDRVGRVDTIDIADTPITMCRNRAVQAAQQMSYDLLMMVDSDMSPDLHIKEPGAKRFWDSSFDFIYSRLGKPTVIGAPYCGPPLHPTEGGEENVYVFQWANMESDEPSPRFKLAPFTRNEAAIRTGIEECGALPTGLIIYTMDSFSLMVPPHFKYEWSDPYRMDKASTEDVYNTREISMAGVAKGHGNPVFVNWDAWAGHVKLKIVGKPRIMGAEQATDTFRMAVKHGINSNDRRLVVKPSIELPPEIEPAEDYLQEPVHHDEVVGSDVVPYLVDGHKIDPLGLGVPESDSEFLREMVLRVREEFPDDDPLRVVEVGSWVGGSAVNMITALNGVGDNMSTIFCVDTWKGSPADETVVLAWASGRVEETFKKNVQPWLGTQIKPITGLSSEVGCRLDNQEAHLVIIDADHTYASVAEDIRAWLPHVHPDGYLIGHDYDNFVGKGVKAAVDQAFGPLVRVSDEHNYWVVSMRDVIELSKTQAESNGELEEVASDADAR